MAKIERRDPAERAQLVERPDIDQDRRGDAEIDEIGERIELGAEARRRLQEARDAPVDAVEGGGDGDQRDGQLEALLRCVMRIEVRPAQSASSVTRLGRTERTGTCGSWRRRLRPWPSSGSKGWNSDIAAQSILTRALGAAVVAEAGDDRFAGDRGLALGDEDVGGDRQIDVEARAEADQADALAGGERVALLDEADDAPRHQTGDLDDADRPVRALDDDAVPLVALARLVELGVEELARRVGDLRRPCRRAARGSRGSRRRS